VKDVNPSRSVNTTASRAVWPPSPSSPRHESTWMAFNPRVARVDGFCSTDRSSQRSITSTGVDSDTGASPGRSSHSRDTNPVSTACDRRSGSFRRTSAMPEASARFTARIAS
jgi:hypothetical protein